MTTDSGARLLALRPRQPDQRSCGASVLVVERALRDEAYAELLVGGRHPLTGLTLPGTPETRFADEALAMHHRTTGMVAIDSGLQLPWPRALGTPPWAVARQVGGGDVAAFLPGGSTADRLVAALTAGRTVPVFVGSLLLPRHVMLALDVVEGRRGTAVRAYDPATGRVRSLALGDLRRRRVSVGRWSRAWWAVLPD